MRTLRRSLVAALLLAPGLFSPGCNLGPFPHFLEPLDPLDPVKGEVQGWILAEEERSQILVLSVSGRFLHSIVNHNTSVRLDTGSYQIEGGALIMRSEYRYEFPKETGPIKDRDGAQSKEVDLEKAREAVLEDGRLTIKDWGTFIATEDFVRDLDLETRDGRGCLLKYLQLSIRTIQARIRNFGGGGTVIYHNNESSFAGFLQGEQTIVVNNLLSPDTVITYRNFRDFPEVLIDGTFVTHVNTSGDGTLDDSIRFTILGTSPEEEDTSAEARGGAGGMGGQSSLAVPVIAEGRLIYGPQDPIEITQADVSGGSYDFELNFPFEQSDNFDWAFLEDLDMRGCYSLN
jgi:hypothetical protein